MKQALAIPAALAAALWLTPALAQSPSHDGHGMSGMDMPGMKDSPAAEPSDAKPDAMQGMDHSGHTMTMDASPMHAMPMKSDGAIPQSPPPPAAQSGPAHAADAFYPDGEMAHAREMVTHEMGGLKTTVVMVDRLEAQTGKGGGSWAWEGALRTGGDIDRLWIKTEGEGELDGGIDDSEVQALWGHAIGPWFDLQAGVRQQFMPGPDRTQLSVGVEGLAPYMFDISAEAFVSTQGEFTAKIGAEIDQRLTQRLILQPRVEANLSAQDVPEIGLGAGVTSLQTGVRLRYEFRREFAPYVGVEWQKQFGRTADYTRADGGNADRVVALVGLRAWF
ncbi:copper resistance protein B [Novosphingobium sp. ZN18A2]|uniref:copper resistance protein B n=1 Tax=Novosphingobium sp. ZN18A2 TaxID=3079861 RepID=UPI0030D29B17